MAGVEAITGAGCRSGLLLLWLLSEGELLVDALMEEPEGESSGADLRRELDPTARKAGLRSAMAEGEGRATSMSRASSSSVGEAAPLRCGKEPPPPDNRGLGGARCPSE